MDVRKAQTSYSILGFTDLNILMIINMQTIKNVKTRKKKKGKRCPLGTYVVR